MSEVDSKILLFKCAFAEDGHFFINPILQLTCGHHICKSCMPSNGLLHKKCKICKKRNKIDLRLVDSTTKMNDLINDNFEILFDETQNNFSRLFVKIKEAVNKMNDSVEIKVEYVRNEIEIRIESLKNELDKINLNLNNQLTVIRDELYSINKIASGVDIELYEDSLMKLRTMVKNKTSKTHEDFALYQNQIKIINEGLKKLNDINHQLIFKSSESTISDNIVGKIDFRHTKDSLVKSEPSFKTTIVKKDPFNFINRYSSPEAEFRRNVDSIYKQTIMKNQGIQSPRSIDTSNENHAKFSSVLDSLANSDGKKIKENLTKPPEYTTIQRSKSNIIQTRSHKELINAKFKETNLKLGDKVTFV